MKRSTEIAKRIREVYLNGKWIANTNLKEQVADLEWQQAVQQVGNLNTIALLVFHLNYYLAGLMKVFQGGKLEISDKYSFNLPGIHSAAEWAALVNDFLSNAEQFATQIEQLDDDLLDQPFADEKYGSYLRNIEGVIEHSYYHLGQVVLIKKMIVAS